MLVRNVFYALVCFRQPGIEKDVKIKARNPDDPKIEKTRSGVATDLKELERITSHKAELQTIG